MSLNSVPAGAPLPRARSHRRSAAVLANCRCSGVSRRQSAASSNRFVTWRAFAMPSPTAAPG
eukprot:10347373-Lingulodinium_polyedra.AAC.1